MRTNSEELAQKVAELVAEIVDPLHDEINEKRMTINKCYRAMTTIQRCKVFDDRECITCEDLGCAFNDSASRRPKTTEHLDVGEQVDVFIRSGSLIVRDLQHGTVIKVHTKDGGTAYAYDVEAEDGEIRYLVPLNNCQVATQDIFDNE